MRAGEARDRRTLRLRGYDYATAGAYFVTVCAQDHRPVFGQVIDGEMRLSAYGDIVRQVWEDLPSHYPHVELDMLTIMPNHVHGIIVLAEQAVGAGLRPAPTDPWPNDTTAATPPRHGLPEIVRAFKGFSTRRINCLRGTLGAPIWQRNYYEHFIRDEADLERIRQYLLDNPLAWDTDRENPRATLTGGTATPTPARPFLPPWLGV